MMETIPSAAQRRWQVDAPVLALVLNGQGVWAAASLADGRLAFLPAADTGIGPSLVPAHRGAPLCLVADADGYAFLSGGEDGRLLLLDPESDVPNLLARQEGQKITAVATCSQGWRAYACGSRVFLLDEAGQSCGEAMSLAGEVQQMAFSPQGDRVAIAHEKGLALWEIKKRHVGALSPETFLSLLWVGESLWAGRRGGGADVFGGSGKPSSFATDAPVQAMALTAEKNHTVLAMGSQVVARHLSSGRQFPLGEKGAASVTHLAPHPHEEVVSIGYSDGSIIMAPLDGRKELLLHPPLAPAGHAVTGLAWNKEGDALLAAQENGSLMLFSRASVAAFVRQWM